MSFFQFFTKNSLLSCPLVVKKRHSDKTTLLQGPKKLIRSSSFRLFTKKSMLLSTYFVKIVHSLKKSALKTILSQKRQFFQNRRVPMSFFFQICQEKTPCCHAHIWSKKRRFCQNNILKAKQVNIMAFFSDIS